MVDSSAAAYVPAMYPWAAARPSLAGEHGGEFLTTPLGMARAVLKRVLGDEAIEVVR